MMQAAKELRSALASVVEKAATLQPPPNLCVLLAELASCGGEITFAPRGPGQSRYSLASSPRRFKAS